MGNLARKSDVLIFDVKDYFKITLTFSTFATSHHGPEPIIPEQHFLEQPCGSSDEEGFRI